MGVVGGATAEVLGKKHEILPYDKYKMPYNSQKNLEDIAANADSVFICVPTPMKSSGAIDYSPIYNSIDALTEEYKRDWLTLEDKLIIIRSTAVSGTTDKLAEKYPFQFAFNPEFLKEKTALQDMQTTDRIIIGANNISAIDRVKQIYLPIFPDAKYITVNTKTAEMIKYAANVTLASQIAVANEIHNICEAVGVNYNEVKDAILHDSRIGNNIDVPGPNGDFGFGGKCFPKDLNALIYLAREKMYRPYLLEEVWRLNERVRKDKDWLK